MATIDSVDLYLGLSSARSGWDVTVDIRDFGGYSINPEQTASLGTKSMDVSNVPLISGSGPDWVRFTFDSPITVSSSNYIGLLVDTDAPSDYQAAPLRWYYAQDWDLAPQVPPDGGEKFYRYSSAMGWVTFISTCLTYRLNCTGCDDNDATNPSGSYYSFGSYPKMGHRIYLDALALPSKPTNPDPADDATDVDFSDLTLDWDDGGEADTFDVYVGDAVDNLTLVVSGTALTTRTLTSTQRDDLFTDHCYWRIDATNEYGTTTGDVWDFTVASPGKATTPVPNDDQEGVYIAGIDRLKELSWSAPSGETPTYKVYFTLPGESPVLVDTTTSLYYTLSEELQDALDYFSIYQWRVDTYDPVSELTTTGDTWTFISDKSHSFTDFSRRSDYDPDQVWQPGTGWSDINSFEYTGGGRYKAQLIVIGHKCIYFGSL